MNFDTEKEKEEQEGLITQILYVTHIWICCCF